MKFQNQTSNLFQFKINLSLFTCVLSYSLFVCISAFANVYFKTSIVKQNIKTILIAGVPLSQALPGFLITAHPSVCVPDVISVLAVWIQNQTKKNEATQKQSGEPFENSCIGPGQFLGSYMMHRVLTTRF